MSPSLPTDILDLIADHLHDEPTKLRACCLVSKSWVPRTRRHLFAFLEFDASPRSESTLELWMKAFPDPSNSPARYTRGLHLARYLAITVAISKARRWVHSFNHLTYLAVTTAGVDDHHISFTQLHGLSPSLKSLRLSYSHAPLPELLALICSFPLLEDLVLGSVRDRENTPEWDAPPTSPKFIGSLCLGGKTRDITRKLLDLPGGLHFSSIAVSCPIEDGDLANELVSMCSDTLESFLLDFSYLGTLPTTPANDQYLITARGYRWVWDTAFA